MKTTQKMGFSTRLISLVDKCNVGLQYFGVFILGAMTLAVFSAVVSRFFIGFSLSWVEESATFAMAWICALGGGLTARKGGLTTIELLVIKLPVKAQKFFAVIASLISFLIFAVIIYFGTRMAMVVSTQRATTLPGLTMFWVYIAMPIGILVMFINTLIHTIEIVSGGSEK